MRRKVLIAISVLAILPLVAACGSATSSLTGKTWQLSAITSKTPAFQGVIPSGDQARYTITFNTDGTYSGTADCNSISGTYTTSGSNGITVAPGASTMMACADESFGPMFGHALTTATTWSVANDELTLSNASGGTMTFGVGSGASASPSAEASASPAASSVAAADLVGIPWQLTAITEKTPAFQGVVPPADQAKYTITFNDDQSFDAKADCNNVSGTYSVGASNALTITLGPSTLAACPEGSLSDLYLFGLSGAASYAVANDQLTITTRDGGTLEFAKGS